ncbi:MAG: DUF456 domain-containing protein [Candidatus Nanopelagicales bacterium]
MPAWGEALVAVVCLVGIVGTVLPVLPGDWLIGVAVVVWAVVERSAVSWAVAAAVVVVLVAGHVLTVLLPGRQMRQAGVPTFVLVLGGVVGIVGFFVVPVVGLPLGFVLGVFVAELVRLRERGPAWASTVEAMKGTGLAVLISFTAAVIATSLWATAAITT